MEGGIDKFQILVVVLVVLAQAASALRSWYRRNQERRRQEEARLGLPGDRGLRDRETRQEQEASDNAELPDWDTFEEEPEPVQEARLPTQDRPLPSPVIPPTPVVALVAEDEAPANPSENAYTNPRPEVGMPSSSSQQKTRRLGDLSLRQAVLAREILSPPLSFRGRRRSIGRR